MEMVDALRQHGASPKEDIEALGRRLVFNILISNTDDHLRNHGFLYGGQGGMASVAGIRSESDANRSQAACFVGNDH